MFSTENDWATIYGRKYDAVLSHFDTIPECDGRTDGRTDRISVSILRVSIAVLMRDKEHVSPPTLVADSCSLSF